MICWPIFFTKPLQGALFKRFRDVIMGFKHIDTLKNDTPSSELKERVEISNDISNNLVQNRNVSSDNEVRNEEQKRKETERKSVEMTYESQYEITGQSEHIRASGMNDDVKTKREDFDG